MSWPWNPVQRSLSHWKWYHLKDFFYGFLLVFSSNFVPKMHRFWDIGLITVQWPWNPGYGSLKVIGTFTYRSATYDFLLTFHSNHALISCHFHDNQRFQSKIAKFPVLSCVPDKGVALRIGYRRRGSKKLEWRCYRADKEVWRYLQPSRYNPPTWQTDGRTEGQTNKHRATAKTAFTPSVAR